METINILGLRDNLSDIASNFQSRKPFRYVEFKDFLLPEAYARILSEFPEVDTQTWVDASGLHTKKKWTQPSVSGSAADTFYKEIQSNEFIEIISQITSIPEVLPDPELFGAGYHQTLDGGYLDVHVDFNIHEKTGLDRRLNLIVYMNREWDSSFGGALQLWDYKKMEMLCQIPPYANTAVLFETNEISYHGHPVPWNSGGKSARMSLSTYYYSQGRDDILGVKPHNTLYINTEGSQGLRKTFANGMIDILKGGPIGRRLRK